MFFYNIVSFIIFLNFKLTSLSLFHKEIDKAKFLFQNAINHQ